jgi:hypothetical protein
VEGGAGWDDVLDVRSRAEGWRVMVWFGFFPLFRSAAFCFGFAFPLVLLRSVLSFTAPSDLLRSVLLESSFSIARTSSLS